MKFGTIVEMVMKSKWTNFLKVITSEPFDLEKLNLVHLIPLLVLITFSILY